MKLNTFHSINLILRWVRSILVYIAGSSSVNPDFAKQKVGTISIKHFIKKIITVL